MDIGRFGELIKIRLKGSLPGSEAHIKMAPSDRIRGIYPAKANGETTTGAVLILLYQKANRIRTVLMQRPAYPGAHSNQISFPGGKSERDDLSIRETAIREAEEEVGVSGNEIRICGTLSPIFIPVSNIEVTPVVAITCTEPAFEPDPAEVSFIIEATIQELADPVIIKTKKMEISGQVVTIPFYELRGLHIWGATAMIISEFLEVYTALGSPLQ